MATTTVRLPEELKARVARAAKRAGTTPHGFILEAIAELADARERRDEFLGVADRRYAEIVATGASVPWSAMRRFLEARISGATAKRPRARKLAP